MDTVQIIHLDRNRDKNKLDRGQSRSVAWRSRQQRPQHGRKAAPRLDRASGPRAAVRGSRAGWAGEGGRISVTLTLS